MGPGGRWDPPTRRCSIEFARCAIERKEDIRDQFIETSSSLRSEIRAWAGRSTGAACDGSSLQVVFGSDIGHWDVTDLRAVLAEAHELFEDGRVSPDGFRAFTFDNAVRLHGRHNPTSSAVTSVERRPRRSSPRRRMTPLILPLILPLIDAATARDPDRTASSAATSGCPTASWPRAVRSLAGHLLASGVGASTGVRPPSSPRRGPPSPAGGPARGCRPTCPLDPTYPPHVSPDMPRRSGSRRADRPPTSSSASRLPARAGGGSIVELDRSWPAIRGDAGARGHAGDRGRRPCLRHLHLGFDRAPKGVYGPAPRLANLGTAQIETFAIDAASVVLQFAPFSFDASVSEVFTALAGRRALSWRRATSSCRAGWPSWCGRHRCHHRHPAPSSLALLDPGEFPTLRTSSRPARRARRTGRPLGTRSALHQCLRPHRGHRVRHHGRLRG